MNIATRKSNPGRTWRMLRILTQILFFFLFLAFFAAMRRNGLQPQTANLAVRLSPLTILSNMLASRTFLVGSLVGLVIVWLALIFGRAWCGWLCPLGSLIELFSFKKLFKKKAKVGNGWRVVKFVVLIVVLTTAFLGNLSLLTFDPVTIFYRTSTTALWPGLDWLVTQAEIGLYKVPALQNAIGNFDALIRPAVLPFDPVLGRDVLLFVGFLVIILGLNLLAKRFWCRYLCPLGGLLGLLAKIGLVKRQVLPSCTKCNTCARVCPTATIDAKKGYASDPAECTMCMDCYAACLSEAIAFKSDWKPASWNEYDPGRRSVLAGLGVGLTIGVVSKVTAKAVAPNEFLMRPPGSTEAELLKRCIRCSACMRICPISALQPAITEAGWDGLWTPVLVPRIGYCDYGCNLCGLTCPVQAIPPLPLEEKQHQIIGKASIDRNRCFAWGFNQNCVVCEEMCPLPGKAIHFAPPGVKPKDRTVQLPIVDRTLCIGCGVCENKCPVVGEAAIRVRRT